MRPLLSALCLALVFASAATADAKPVKGSKSSKKAAAPQGEPAATHPAPAAKPAPASKKDDKQDEVDQTRMATRGPTRLDFDDRLVQGQGSKAGAVYLYDRKDLPLRSMVKQRDNFRDQIANEQLVEVLVE